MKVNRMKFRNPLRKASLTFALYSGLLLFLLWHNRGINSEAYYELGLLTAYKLSSFQASLIGLISGIGAFMFIYLITSELKTEADAKPDRPIETKCLLYVVFAFSCMGFLPFLVFFLGGTLPLNVIDIQFLAMFFASAFVLGFSSYYYILFRKKSMALDVFACARTTPESLKLEFKFWLQIITAIMSIVTVAITGFFALMMITWYFKIEDTIRLSAPFRRILTEIMLIFILIMAGIWWGFVGQPWGRLHSILKEIRRIEAIKIK